MAGSNYDVNIKLDVRKINQQISNLEKRISKLNALAQGKKGDSKTLLKNERDKTAQLLKQERAQKKINRELERTNKLKKEELNLIKKTASGGSSTNRTGNQASRDFTRSVAISTGKFAGSGPGVFGPQPKPSLGSTALSKLGLKGDDISGALISGAFPLLFGQGPIGAAAGFGGGLIGSKIGGQTGGFAGGLVATAALTQIQQLLDSTGKLGQAFSTLTPDVEGLTRALGANGTEREKQIQLIKKTQGEQAALAAVTEQMNQQIGEKGVKNLKEFGETSRLIGNSFQILGTKMLAAIAPLLNLLANPLKVEAAKAETNRLANVGGAAKDEELQTLQTRLGNVGRGRSANKQRERIREQIEARKEELALLGKTIERRTTVDMVEDSVFKKQRQQNELLQAKLDGNHEEVLLAQQVNEKINEMLETGMGIMEIDTKRIEKQIKQTQELEKQVEIAEKLKEKMFAVGEEIESSIKNNLRDAITGAQSFGEAMSNVLNKIRDKLLDKALDNLFSGFGKNFGKSATGGKGKGIGGFIGGLFGFADGGRPPVGRPSIVGERGPELFVPRSAGTIVPNEKIGGSSITNNISISVDATNSNVQSDGDGQQFGQALATAVQLEIVKQKRSGGLLT